MKGVGHNNSKDVKRFLDERHSHSYMVKFAGVHFMFYFILFYFMRNFRCRFSRFRFTISTKILRSRTMRGALMVASEILVSLITR
jgi:hypothetical protein